MASKEERAAIQGSAAKTVIRSVMRHRPGGLEEQFPFNSLPFTVLAFERTLA